MRAITRNSPSTIARGVSHGHRLRPVLRLAAVTLNMHVGRLGTIASEEVEAVRTLLVNRVQHDRMGMLGRKPGVPPRVR
jgi:hypothetical protein